MALSKHIHIARRFLRSIRIDSDLGDPQALEGFICPPSATEVLLTMVRHVSETNHGGFTWTGPYGSGKSSLVVALSALLSGDSQLHRKAAKIFGRKLTSKISKVLPPGSKGWRILPVVGRRGDPAQVIGEALATSKLIQRKPRGGWTEQNVLKAITEIAEQRPKVFGGLVIFIDEMGKFLEAAAQESEDIYLFQQLAEVAARSNGRLLVVGILHQAFEEYAHRLSHEIRDEWAKIQGRYLDLAINIAGEEQIDLISKAIECDCRPQMPSSLAQTTALFARRDRPEEAKRLSSMLESCWPIHPVVTCLLGPISRRRFGQNQRSIFGFLNSAEPYGFQEFIGQAEDNELYSPDRLWDYLRANLEPSILASPDGHRWALASEALERCEATGGDACHLKLLKSIAVIDLFKERSGLVANFELLRSCVPEVSQTTLKKSLRQLQKWSFTIFKKFLDAHVIYAGSDFDIEQAVREALLAVDEIDFKALKVLADIQPVLAKRHYHETGTMRWFDVSLVPVRDLVSVAEQYVPGNGTIGQFLLAVPAGGEREDQAAKQCRDAARLNGLCDIIVGLSKRSWAIVALARELIALEFVRNNRSELAGDPVARKEVGSRLATLQGQLEVELHKAFDGATWYRKNSKAKTYRQAELNGLASELADNRFDECPNLHNELLNRQKPSASAIAAQNTLLRSMVSNVGVPRLGIQGFPAEGGLFASLLEATGLYRQHKSEWRFVVPRKAEYRLLPMWEAANKFVKSNSDRPVAIAEIYDIWKQPPFGVKDGLMPVLVVAFIMSQSDKIVVYREGVFRAKFSDIDVEYLAKDPVSIQVRWMNLTTIARGLLGDMAEVVRALSPNGPLVHMAPIDVARGLVSIYEELPMWTKRTMQLSANAVQIRDLFKKARDPNKFLFDDIPQLIEDKKSLEDQAGLTKLVRVVHEGLDELVRAYPAMLHRLQDLMLSELQVPNTSPKSLAELRERAENARNLAGDFHLEAFVGRLSLFDGSNERLEGIASLAANKPPREWVDLDLDRATINLADLAQKFLRAETYARVKGRSAKRHAMAVVIGSSGAPKPLLEEFEVLESDRTAIDELVGRLAEALDGSDTSRRSAVLAALAELSARYIESSKEPLNKKKRSYQNV